MTPDRKELSARTEWGASATLLTGIDRRFLPGAFALFNSARMNGFTGRFIIGHFEPLDPALCPAAPGLSYELLPEENPRPHHFVKRIDIMLNREPGDYCCLDSDILFERPCGFLLDGVEDGIVVSTEADQRYDPRDLWVREQCRRAGVAWPLPPHPYVNVGLIGFRAPRDSAFLSRYSQTCRTLFADIDTKWGERFFPFTEQDVFNLFVRERLAKGEGVASLSYQRMELGVDCIAQSGWDRPFPAERQTVRPSDIYRMIIHGASLRRPWLAATAPGWRGRAESLGLLPWRRRRKGSLTPYERAWAWYTCSPGLPIDIEAWAPQHGFTAHRNRLWRSVFGLPPR